MGVEGIYINGFIGKRHTYNMKKLAFKGTVFQVIFKQILRLCIAFFTDLCFLQTKEKPQQMIRVSKHLLIASHSTDIQTTTDSAKYI